MSKQAEVIAKIEKALGLTVEVKANEAMSSTQVGYGDEFVPTELTTAVLENARDESTILSKIAPSNIWKMPTNPYDLPVEGGDPTWYKASENDDSPYPDATESKVGTAKVRLDATKITAHVKITSELVEDATIAQGIRQYVVSQLGKSYAEIVDSMILNGDTTTAGTGNVNSDDAALSSVSPLLAFNGLRRNAFDDSKTLDISALTAQDFLNVRKLLPYKYSANSKNLLVIMNPETYFKALALDEVLTVEKFGQGATILNGALASVFGMPIIPSSQFGLQDVDGKYTTLTPAANVTGGFVIVHLPSVHIGFKREMQMFIEYKPEKDIYLLTAHARVAKTMTRTGMSALGYNGTV